MGTKCGRPGPFLLAFSFLWIASQGGHAQEREPSDPKIVMGIGGGLVTDPPIAFSNKLCPVNTAGAFFGKLGYRALRPLTIEVGLTAQVANENLCINGFIFPLENGTQRITRYPHELQGYPHTSVEGRVVFDPMEAPFGLRLIGGGGRMLDKGIGLLLAGGGLRGGSDRFRGALDFEVWWFDVPFTIEELTYEDGVVVSEREIAAEQSESPLILRVGFEVLF